MATIGNFTKTENGFTGMVKTLNLNVKTVKFVPAEGDSERGPDFRIFAGAINFGAAWKKTARETQREYLSVKLDDPSFPAPIYASLVEADDGESHNLIWSRRANSFPALCTNSRTVISRRLALRSPAGSWPVAAEPSTILASRRAWSTVNGP